MNLTTKYLGMKLHSPLVPSASPLSEEIDNLKQMEDAGAGAVVLYSLFEEQLRLETFELHHHLEYGAESFPEALSFFPQPQEYHLGPDAYLEHIRKAKAAINIPVIASLNGSSLGGWTKFAQQMQQAGADALELNLYNIPTELETTGAQIEQRYLDVLRAVKEAVTIPVALKLSPFFSNMANMAKRFDDAGANGLVLFNRFYQPDIDLETLDVRPNVILSTPQAQRLPMRWIAILHGRIKASLAATSGIHEAKDLVKMLMAGANVTMLCSVLLRHGIYHLRILEQELRRWMEEHEYVSVQQMQGSMSQKNCPDPTAYERAQYMKAITSYKPFGIHTHAH